MKRNGLVTLFLALVCFLAAVGIGFVGYTAYQRFCPSQDEVQKQETIVEVDNATYTIDDVLQMRETEREYRMLDSVFMVMPDIALIAILIKNGTDMSHSDIAIEYLRNKGKYNDVEFGAQINEIYKQHTQREPDSLPPVCIPDTIKSHLILFIIILLSPSVKIEITSSENDKHVGRK